jgi:hypothetical protein
MALVPAAAAGSGAPPSPPPDAIASVPAAPGSRLFFTWGAGTQLRLCELQGAAGAAHHASTVSWCEASRGRARRCPPAQPHSPPQAGAILSVPETPARRLSRTPTHPTNANLPLD